MKSVGLIVLVLGCLVAGGCLAIVGQRYWPFSFDQPTIPTVSTPTDRHASVTALGRIEPAAGLITVGVPLPDRIAYFENGIRKGATVEAGDALVVLDSQRDRQDEYALISLQCQEADSKYKQIKELGEQRIALDALRKKQMDKMEPLQVGLQQAKIALLEKQLEAARNTLKRLGDASSGVVSKQEREQQELLVFRAQSELQAARDMLDKQHKENQLERELVDAKLATGRLELNKNLMELPLENLRRQKEITKRKLDETTLKAPCRGEILQLFASAGEIVGGAQPILQMADTSRMAVVAEVYETDVGRIHKGQKVQVKSRVWPDQVLTGVVDNIGNMIARNRIIDADPTANVDRRVLEVRALLDHALPAATLINLQVTVYFLENGKAK